MVFLCHEVRISSLHLFDSQTSIIILSQWASHDKQIIIRRLLFACHDLLIVKSDQKFRIKYVYRGNTNHKKSRSLFNLPLSDYG